MSGTASRGRRAEIRFSASPILSLFHSSIISVFLLSVASVFAGEPPATTGGKPELMEHPAYRAPEPQPRGRRFAPPGSPGFPERSPVIWGWRLALPDGSGLMFGGISVRTDDPRPPTQVLKDGKWISLREELRKQNPLQANHDAVAALRPLLLQITGRARNLYFRGLDEAAEKAVLEKDIAPRVVELIGKIQEAGAALSKAGSGAEAYAAGQAAFARGQLDAVLPALEGLGTRTSPEKLAALRQARISLERATDALDAEPPARAFSMPAYDAKTGRFAVFGGDHGDYLMNDFWVFDPQSPKWRQSHPKTAPEPRALHILESDGAGKLKMRGGYLYYRPTPGWDEGYYVHAGPGDWTYDLAAEAWQGPAGAPVFTNAVREYRQGGYLPDAFTQGARPDAAAHEKTLAGLPANTWVDLKPPVRFAGGRDWATVAFDPDRDILYLYGGGHCVYSGTDVLHYHLAANRWDQPIESEFPPGYISGSEGMPGWSFNRRPWICGHSWNSYGYHPGLRKVMVNGRQGLNNRYVDPNAYVYDPDAGDWTDRKATPRPFDVYGTQVRHVPGLGLITWVGEIWTLDDRTLDWTKANVKGKLPGTPVDFCGLVYDSKRKRELFFSGGSYSGAPYSGEVFALDPATLEASSFKPEGSEHIQAMYAGKENTLGTWILREVAYHPGADLVLFGSSLPGGYTAALDLTNNRWIGLKLPGPFPWGLSAGLVYDAKRDLFFAADHHARVSALRLDPKTLVSRTLAEIVAEAAEAAKAAQAAAKK